MGAGLIYPLRPAWTPRGLDSGKLCEPHRGADGHEPESPDRPRLCPEAEGAAPAAEVCRSAGLRGATGAARRGRGGPGDQGSAALTPPAPPAPLPPAAPRRDGGRGQQHPLPAQRPQRFHQRLGHPRGRRLPSLLERAAPALSRRPRPHAPGPAHTPQAPPRPRPPPEAPSPRQPHQPLSCPDSAPGHPPRPPPPTVSAVLVGFDQINGGHSPGSSVRRGFGGAAARLGSGGSGREGAHLTFREVRGHILEPAGLHHRPWLVAEGQRLAHTEEILAVQARPPPTPNRPWARPESRGHRGAYSPFPSGEALARPSAPPHSGNHRGSEGERSG